MNDPVKFMLLNFLKFLLLRNPLQNKDILFMSILNLSRIQVTSLSFH